MRTLLHAAQFMDPHYKFSHRGAKQVSTEESLGQLTERRGLYLPLMLLWPVLYKSNQDITSQSIHMLHQSNAQTASGIDFRLSGGFDRHFGRAELCCCERQTST